MKRVMDVCNSGRPCLRCRLAEHLKYADIAWGRFYRIGRILDMPMQIAAIMYDDVMGQGE